MILAGDAALTGWGDGRIVTMLIVHSIFSFDRCIIELFVFCAMHTLYKNVYVIYIDPYTICICKCKGGPHEEQRGVEARTRTR